MNKGYLIWITGLAGSGKTTIAKKVWQSVKEGGDAIIFLDGDRFREVMGNDLGHDHASRLQNAYRIARMCHLLVEQGTHVVCATISLFDEIHAYNRKMNENYLEVFIECSLEKLKERNQKGLYTSSSNVVGIDQSFHRPRSPDLVLQNDSPKDLELNIEKILTTVRDKETVWTR